MIDIAKHYVLIGLILIVFGLVFLDSGLQYFKYNLFSSACGHLFLGFLFTVVGTVFLFL